MNERFIGISREGTASLSWATNPSEKKKCFRWVEHFLGVYLMLGIHVLGGLCFFFMSRDSYILEKTILYELSKLSAASGAALLLITRGKTNYSEICAGAISVSILLLRYSPLLMLLRFGFFFWLTPIKSSC